MEVKMKNAIITLIIGFTALSLKAAHFSNLTLNMVENARYEIVFNNQIYGNTGNFFTLNNLAPGRYYMTVSRLSLTHWGTVKNMIYNGPIDIPAASEVHARVDRFNKLQLSYSPIYPINPYNPGHCGISATYYEPLPLGMHPDHFMQLKNTINNQWFDSGKLQIAKQALAMNSLTSAQVAELMTLFSFESSRLEFAKAAYRSTIDKQNYYVVNNQFSFSSSVRELDRYIYSF